MSYTQWYCLFFLISLFFLACQQPKQRSVYPAFYHWKNTLDLSTSELDYLKDLNVQRIYLRFFDVDWEGEQAIPISIMNKKADLPDSISIVPTVFITNRTLLELPEAELPTLANKIFTKIQTLSKEFSEQIIPEVQFDCDWSMQSKDNYFRLLDLLKAKLKTTQQKISVTIRLHQIKFFEKTGVPPVDRGVLMFYNMGEINAPDTENSIIDLNLAKQYLERLPQYPLPLDVALPIFKWGLVFQNNQLVKIINNLDVKDLEAHPKLIKISKNRFELLKSTYIQGYYLYQKDQIRLESISTAQLQQAADLLSEGLRTNQFHLIFYHLDALQIEDYPHEVLEDIHHRFD